jgi:hypothetical protein
MSSLRYYLLEFRLALAGSPPPKKHKTPNGREYSIATNLFVILDESVDPSLAKQDVFA